MLTSLSESTAESSRLDRYWLVLHSISTFPPFRGPSIVIGRNPSLVSTFAPNALYASASGPTGLFERLSSPVIVILLPSDAARPRSRYVPVPLFPKSRVMASPLMPNALESTLSTFFSASYAMSTPNALSASMVEHVSEERSGFLIVLMPFANDAISKALIVWLFEAGTSIVPEGLAGVILIIRLL